MNNTREKLIELVNAVLRCLPWGEISSHTADDVADHLIANGVTVQQWIPVTERLPKHGEVVLVYTKHKDIFIVQRDSVSGFWLGERFDVPNKIITHWMPLPSAPKGE